MNQMPGINDEDSKTRNLHQIPAQPGPTGVPAHPNPAGSPGTGNQIPPPQSQRSAYSGYPRPAAPPAASLPRDFPPTYPQNNPGYGLSPAASYNQNSAAEKASPANRLAVIALIIGIVIALAYLGFLVFLLVKTKLMALPASLPLPDLPSGLSEQLINSSQVILW